MWRQGFAAAMLLFGLLTVWLGQALAAGADISFPASDGETVYATLNSAQPRNPRLLLLFHQAGSNRHEYDPLIPALRALGFDTLAVDQRSGGERFGDLNETVQARGESDTYLAAYDDLKGALTFAQARGYSSIISVGSSYSASLNILLGRDFPQVLRAIVCFSPGEYFQDAPDTVKQAAAEVTLPFYITTPAAEDARVDEVLSRTSGGNIVRYRQAAGVHGASTLVQDRNSVGYQANLDDFSAFLSRHADTP